MKLGSGDVLVLYDAIKCVIMCPHFRSCTLNIKYQLVGVETYNEMFPGKY